MLDKREAESVMSSVMVWKKRLAEDELVPSGQEHGSRPGWSAHASI